MKRMLLDEVLSENDDSLLIKHPLSVSAEYSLKHTIIKRKILSNSKIEKLIETGCLRVKKQGRNILVSQQDVNRIIYMKKLLEEHYIYYLDLFSEILGKTVKSQSHFQEAIINLMKQNILDVVFLDEAHTFNKKSVYVSRKSFQDFKEKYVSIQEIVNTNGVCSSGIMQKIARDDGNIEIINFNDNSKALKYRFVNRKDIARLIVVEKIISKKELGVKLGLADTAINQVCIQFKIQSQITKGKEIPDNDKRKRVFIGREFYSFEVYDFLIQEQEKQWEFYSEHYYTAKEVENKLLEMGFNSSSRDHWRMPFFNNFRNNKENRIKVPPIISIVKDGRDFKFQKTLYKKVVIDEYINFKLEETQYQNLIINNLRNPLIALRKAIDYKGLKFPSACKDTEENWYIYCNMKLIYHPRNKGLTERILKDFIMTTEFLIEVLSEYEKEIMLFSNHELKIRIFNNQIERYKRVRIASYLDSFLKENKHNVAIKYTSEVYANVNASSQTMPKEVYTIDEYSYYLEYCTDLKLHKNIAIEDLKSLFKKGKYKNYASTWLYVILHLNNKWRRFQVTEFQSIINLEVLDIFRENNGDFNKILDALLIDDLNEADVNKIANTLRAHISIHNKNKMPKDLIWTDITGPALALSLLICEIRLRLISVDNKFLIDFNTKKRELKLASEKEFFSGMKNYRSIKFSSRKFNRTLSSLVYEVGKSLGNDAVLDIARSLRNHKKLISTNIYLLFSKEKLDEIADQLFNAGPFGFVFTTLSNLLDNKKTDNQLIQNTYSIQNLRRIFGDWVKVEEIINVQAEINSSTKLAKEQLEQLNSSEMEMLYRKMLMGINSSKVDGLMCMFNTCCFEKDRDKSCMDCPFVVLNFSSISLITSKFISLVRGIKEKSNSNQLELEAERMYLSKILGVQLFRLNELINQFGIDIISMYFEKEREDFIQFLTQLTQLESKL